MKTHLQIKTWNKDEGTVTKHETLDTTDMLTVAQHAKELFDQGAGEIHVNFGDVFYLTLCPDGRYPSTWAYGNWFDGEGKPEPLANTLSRQEEERRIKDKLQYSDPKKPKKKKK